MKENGKENPEIKNLNSITFLKQTKPLPRNRKP